MAVPIRNAARIHSQLTMSCSQQRAHNRQQHAHFAGEHAAPRGGRRIHPLQRENKQRRRNNVGVLNQVPDNGLFGHFLSSRFLNIFSMRSVIRNPLTMLMTEVDHGDEAQHAPKVENPADSGHQDGAHYADARDGVGDRHQWRMQQRRYLADNLQADEGRQHEDVETQFEFGWHGIPQIL